MQVKEAVGRVGWRGAYHAGKHGLLHIFVEIPRARGNIQRICGIQRGGATGSCQNSRRAISHWWVVTHHKYDHNVYSLLLSA